jgi:hypothetical protein
MKQSYASTARAGVRKEVSNIRRGYSQDLEIRQYESRYFQGSKSDESIGGTNSGKGNDIATTKTEEESCCMGT